MNTVAFARPFWTALSKAVEDQRAPLIEKLEEEDKSGTEQRGRGVSDFANYAEKNPPSSLIIVANRAFSRQLQ